MDYFMVIVSITLFINGPPSAQIVTHLLIFIFMAFPIKCSKKQDKRHFALQEYKYGSSSKSSTTSKSTKTPKRIKTDSKEKSAGLLPTQLKAIMEAEKMAKNQKDYDNIDIDLEDLEDDKKK